MLVSYKSDLARIQKTLRLIIKYLANLKRKHPILAAFV